MSAQYEAGLQDLRTAYDAQVATRERLDVKDWKSRERQLFLERLQAEGRRSLLEVGAGPGTHGRFFADNGFEVVCVDLSPAMVEACRAKGLEAYAGDFVNLRLPRRFEAGFALNCLLHVPPADLPEALRGIAAALLPGALLYVGQYGGVDWDGINPEDVYEPKRYFSSLADERMRQLLADQFELIEFKAIDIGDTRPGMHFQSATVRRGVG